MADLKMPFLGGGMEDARVVEWLVRPGQAVHRGDVVAVVDTFKGAIEIEVFEDGVVEALLAEVGARVPVGDALARIAAAGAAEPARAAGAAGASAAAPQAARAPAGPPPEVPPAAAAIPTMPSAGPTPAPQPPPVPAAPPPPAPTLRPPEPPGVPGAPGRAAATPAARRRAAELGVDLASLVGSAADGIVVLADVERAAARAAPPLPSAPPSAARGAPPLHERRISPVARRAAEELGVDLAAVAGTGESGSVTRADVERTAAAVEAPGAADHHRRVAEMRRAIAAAMARSKREIPHYYVSTPIDVSHALAWVERTNTDRPPERCILPAALLLRAVALALREVPELNGFWVDDTFRPGPGVHLGVAVSLRGGGLIAPAIHDADQKSVDEIMTALLDVVRRARTGGLRGSELADPTITVSELGDRGVETVYGIVNPPQVALVGFGKIMERPWAEHGLVGARPVVTASLSADHRVTDGHRGGLFLSALEHLLQEPESL